MDYNEYLALLNRFNEFYYKEVKPQLKFYNSQKNIKFFCIVSVFIIVISFLLIFISSVFRLSFLFLISIISFVVFLFSSFYAAKFFRNTTGSMDMNIESSIKDDILPRFLQIFNFGNLKYTRGINAEGFSKLSWIKSLNILKIFGYLTFDDSIQAEYKDLKFSINEANVAIINAPTCLVVLLFIIFLLFIFPFVFLLLPAILLMILSLFGIDSISFHDNLLTTLISKIITLVVFVNVFCYFVGHKFRGLLIEFDMNKDFEGHTFVLNRSSTSNDIKIDTSKYEEVILEDPEFMSKYKVYSTNQIEARYVLTTAFIERFMKLKTSYKAKYVRLAFKDKKIVVAIHTGRNMFKFADVFTNVKEQTFIDLFNEIYSVFEVAEQLKLNQDLGL